MLIKHDGSNTIFKEQGDGNVIFEVTDATIQFKKGTTETLAEFIPDSGALLYHDNVLKLATTSDGSSTTGNHNATGYRLSGTQIIDSSRNLQNINQATIDEIIGTKYRVVDSRSVATTTDEGTRQVRFDFKQNNNGDSLSDGGTYHGQMLFQQWGDSSGGDTHALGFTDNGNIWHRRADIGGSWDTWYKIVETGRSMDVSLGTISSGAITSTGDISANDRDWETL